MRAARPLPVDLVSILGELGLSPQGAVLARGPRGGAEFLCLPSVAKPQLLVPLHPAAADLVIDRRSRRRISRWAKRGTAGLVRSGLLGRLPVVRLCVDDPALQELIAWTTGRPDALVGVLAGPPRANRKPVLRLLSTEGTTLAYVKVGATPLTQALVRTEAGALRGLAGAGLTGLRLPSVVRTGQWRGRELLVTTPLASGPAARQPARLPVSATRTLFTHGGRDDLPLHATAPFAGPPSPSSALEASGRELLALFGDRRCATGASHGDWTPWNMALGEDGVLDVWDWERYADDTPAGLDIVHFEASRVRADDDFAATDAFLARLPDRLGECGVERESHRLLLATYLFGIGRRYAADLAQLHASRAARRLAWVTRLLDSTLHELTEGVRR